MMPESYPHNQVLFQSLATDKELAFTYHRRPLRFRVSQELFSSYQVDAGSRLLLKTLSDPSASNQVRKVLDLGCGYGALGLSYAAAVPDCSVHLVDRDALAVAFARHNAQLNELTNTTAYGSLDYENVAGADFDLILSNIPGKAGRPVIESILLRAQALLRPGGAVAIVVVPPLAQLVAEVLEHSDVNILLRERGTSHAVFHYQFENGPVGGEQVSAFVDGAYDRDQMTVGYRGHLYSMQSVRGLPEFDKLSHQTELLLSVMEQRTETHHRALIFNTGQGHAAVALHHSLAPHTISLADRDLLALRATTRNLATSGRPAAQTIAHHQVGLPLNEPAELILGTLRDSEGLDANYALIEQAAALLAPGGELLVAGASTTITRLDKAIKQNKLLTVRQRKRNRAQRLLILRARQ